MTGFGLIDVGLTALVLLVFCDPVWRFFLQMPGGELPLVVTVTKAAICAVGFVSLAVQWERGLGLLMRSPLLVVLLVLAPVSALWAGNPAPTLQQGLLLGMVVITGLGLAMRLTAAELALALMLAGGLAATASLATNNSIAFADPTAIGLLFAGALIAATGSVESDTGAGSRWLQWLGCAGLAVALGLSLQAFALAGHAYGVICLLGAAVAFGLHALACLDRPGPMSFVMVGSALILLVSGFALLGGPGLMQTVAGSFDGPILQVVAGAGFAAGGVSLADALGVGLGLAGTGLALLALGWSVVSALAGSRGMVRRGLASVASAAGPVCATGALTGLFLSVPDQVPVVGALVLAWTASWAAGVSPTWRRGASPFALVTSRQADAVDLPPALQRKQPLQPRQARAGALRPSVTRARVAAAMAETALKSGTDRRGPPKT
ncbi:MAG: hypothetical protein MUF14_06360 [Hyphomonadaceae bacterium]|jgi:hypothetical protein|nr:hypothetical protein [Hyphomonadaceae bacterium]